MKQDYFKVFFGPVDLKRKELTATLHVGGQITNDLIYDVFLDINSSIQITDVYPKHLYSYEVLKGNKYGDILHLKFFNPLTRQDILNLNMQYKTGIPSNFALWQSDYMYVLCFFNC